MKIRHLQAEDLETVLRLEKENFAPDEQIASQVLEGYVAHKKNTSLVVEKEGNALAYILSTPIAEPVFTDQVFEEVTAFDERLPYLAVAALSVSASYKRQGLGSLLLAGLKELAVEEGYKGILLTCHDSLISYYEMNGFRDQGVSVSQLGGYVWHELTWFVAER